MRSAPVDCWCDVLQRSARAVARSVGLMVVGLVASNAAAQLGVAIAPARIEALVPPGGKTTETLSFSNTSAVPLSVGVEVVDFDASPTNDVIEQPSGTSANSLAPYLRIAPLQVEVAPGQQVFFRCALRAPARFTQLRAMIYFVAHPRVAKKGAAEVVIVPRLGIPAYLENLKARPGTLDVHAVSARRTGDKGDQLELDLDVTNIGERNIRPTGYLRVRAVDGSFDKAFPFNQGSEPVLPGHRRTWKPTFGPVPGGGLSLRLRFETSPSTSHESDLTVPPASSSR